MQVILESNYLKAKELQAIKIITSTKNFSLVRKHSSGDVSASVRIFETKKGLYGSMSMEHLFGVNTYHNRPGGFWNGEMYKHSGCTIRPLYKENLELIGYILSNAFRK